MNFYNKNNPLLGKTIIKVMLAEDKKALRFDILGEEKPIIGRADGDCCSYSWIEGLDTPAYLLGTVLSVEDINMPGEEYSEEDYEYLQFYGCRITTDKGQCVIDYRNSSNGFYGGDLCWSDEDFYGGVYGQNVSKENWRKIIV